jgi:hypothetical protein
MTWLLLLYSAFLVSGFAVMKAGKSGHKEKAFFAVITSIGCILWGSIVLRRPLDLNKAIGILIDFLF